MDLKNIKFDKSKLNVIANNIEEINLLVSELTENKRFMRKFKRFQKKELEKSKVKISYNKTFLEKSNFKMTSEENVVLKSADIINANSQGFSDNLPLCG